MFISGLVAVTLVALPPAPATLKWRPVAPGGWCAQVGKKYRITLLSAAAAVPIKAALGRLPVVAAPPIDVARAGSQ